MPIAVKADFLVPSGALAAIASDGGNTGALDVGDGTGLDTGDGGELSSGMTACPTLSLEILRSAGSSRLARDTMVPVESIRRVGAGAAGAAETVALTLLDPPTPTESGARRISDAIVQKEGTRASAASSNVLIPVEALSAAHADRSLLRELIASARGESALRVEELVPARADATGPIEAGSRAGAASPTKAEALRYAATDAAAPSEAAALLSLDLGVPAEGSALGSGEAFLPAESSATAAHTVTAAAAMSIESRSTYVVSVTLTLSDGRVITFPTASNGAGTTVEFCAFIRIPAS
jgi:hypothetical protein